MNFFYRFLIILMIFFEVQNVFCQGVVIELKEKVFINSEDVYLSDIAELTGNIEEIENLVKIKIMNSPQVNNPYILTGEKIKMRICQNGTDLKEFELIGKQVEIITEGIVLNREKIEVLLIEDIKNKYNCSEKTRVSKVSIFSVPLHLSVCGKKILYTINVKFTKNGGEAELTFISDGKKTYNRTFGFRIEEECIVYKAVREIKRGTVFSPEFFEQVWEKRIPGRFRPGEIFNINDYKGMTAKKDIRNGSFLVPDAFSLPELVEAGVAVEVIVVRGNVEIQTTGVALNSGSRGDNVQIRLDSNRKTLFGVVEDYRKVSIISI